MTAPITIQSLLLEPSDGTLCRRCAALDWNDAFHFDSSTPVREITVLRQVVISEACLICILFRRSLKHLPEDAQYHLLAITTNTFRTRLIDLMDATILCLTPFRESWDLFDLHMFTLPDSESCLIFDKNSPMARCLKPIEPRIDFGTVRGWLDYCYVAHAMTCLTTGDKVPDLEVIDCNTRLIVPHPVGADYVTLSYVWGKKQNEASRPGMQDQTTDRNTLPPDLPQTINDAITVTLALGFQYLWVDRYCLRQGEENFHIQLKQMNFIYSKSTLTIIATAGTDGFYGLPGVSRLRRRSPTVDLGQRVLASTPSMLGEEFQRSTWNTRAWTFQEGLLATRRLVFTNSQVYFECQGYYRFESISYSHSTLLRLQRSCGQVFHYGLCDGYLSKDNRSSSTLGVFPRNRVGSKHDHIFMRIEEYSRRSLSYQDDILNAIMGVLGEYEYQYSLAHIWGMPYSTMCYDDKDWFLVSPLMGLGNALFWKLRSPPRRRQNFPSWSWTGWFGGVSWDPSLWRLYNVESVRVETKLGELLDWDKYVFWKDHGQPDWDEKNLSRYIRITAYVGRITRLPAHGGKWFLLKVDDLDYNELGPELKLDNSIEPLLFVTENLYVLYIDLYVSFMYHVLLIRKMDDCWERVGMGELSHTRSGKVSEYLEMKEIRLG